VLNGGPLASLFDSYKFDRNATCIAAVSGGSDSTALLILLKAYLDKVHPDVRLIAATVDHGLRPASAIEAKAVGELCGDLGIQHQILNWTGDKPARGVQAAARLARHRLLANFACEQGTAMVFIGHTRDDQAETVMMRQARGGGRGSAGIAPATLYDGRVWFLRPLLDVRREHLREHLTARGIPWAEDPSNRDVRFERARLRAELHGAPESDVRIDQAIAEAAGAAALRVARAHWTAASLRVHAQRVALGLIRLERDALHGSEETVIEMLRVLIALAGGAEQLPDADQVVALLKRLRTGGLRANLSRALIDARKDAVFFLRESRGLPPRMAERNDVWDGRYAVGEGVEDSRVDSSRFDMAPESLVRAAENTEPILPKDCKQAAVVPPWRQFLPLFDLALANEAARLVGAREFPAPPLQGHIETAA
jgi:tRNA(Ile)-lysidine synthase